MGVHQDGRVGAKIQNLTELWSLRLLLVTMNPKP